MKIVYAASENANAKLQCERFLAYNKHHNIKIAAHSTSNINNTNWNLDALKQFYGKYSYNFDNELYAVFANQIKSFNPDLIISDTEYFTSYIGFNFGIPVWQYSPYILRYVICKPAILASNISELGIHNKTDIFYKNMIDNSQRNYVNNFLGDACNYKLKNNGIWTRPYHIIGNEKKTKQNTAINILNDKHFIHYFQQIPKIKTVSNISGVSVGKSNSTKYDFNQEYADIIKNSNYLLTDGIATFMNDAYYNDRYNFIFFNRKNILDMSLACSVKSLGFGDIINRITTPISNIKLFNHQINNHIGYIHDDINTFERFIK